MRKFLDTINKNVIKDCMIKNKWGFKLKMTRLRMSGWQWLENLSNRWEFPGQMYWPIRGQYSGHMICLDQSQTSICLWMRKFQSPVESRWNMEQAAEEPQQIKISSWTGSSQTQLGGRVGIRTCQTGVLLLMMSLVLCSLHTRISEDLYF